MFLAWIFSSNRKILNLRLIFWALGLQFLFALFIFRFTPGVIFFKWLNNVALGVMESSQAGANFLFGPLALAPGTSNEMGQSSLGFILAFQALPTILFFSALIAVLYYFRIMPRLINGFSRIFNKLFNISGAESLVVSSNLFVGIESLLTARPYLSRMTNSEICTVLTAGMATVASNVLAVYVISLGNLFPSIAGHLISATFLSAPAAIIMAKLVYPESEKPKTMGENISPVLANEDNVWMAIINGSMQGLKLIAGIVAMLVAVLGLVALLDSSIGYFGAGFSHLIGGESIWSLKTLLGYVFYPLTLVLGVPVEDVATISRIIGERLILTEVASYVDLAEAIRSHEIVHPRSILIASYALCGFAHVASMAIFVGGFCALAPDKVREISSLGLRSLFAATLACLMTGCVAGVFYHSGLSILAN